MTMYARIEQGVVREIIDTAEPIEGLYHPDLLWVDIQGKPEVRPGWIVGSDGFSAPDPEETSMAVPGIDVGDLLQRVKYLEQQLSLLPGFTGKQPGAVV